MPKPKKPKAKPSFGAGTDEGRRSTGWVYRSDPQPPPKVASRKPAATSPEPRPAAPAPAKPKPARAPALAPPAPPAAAPRPEPGFVEYVVEWLSRPLSMALIMVLAPFGLRSRPPQA